MEPCAGSGPGSPRKGDPRRSLGRYCQICVSERGASLLNDWLGGLLGLFFAIDRLNADDDLGDEFKALESTPMLLGFQGEFKDHRQGRDPGAAPLGSMSSQLDCRKGRFNWI